MNLLPNQLNLTYYDRPGLRLTSTEALAFITELRAVATASFGLDSPSFLPEYQCLVLDSLALNDKLISVARRASDGHMVAFSSVVLLHLPGEAFKGQHALHLGLTCVDPAYRSEGLTKRLVSHIISRYCRSHPAVLFGLRKVWITNIACVLSSLSTVALLFDAVYPSPAHPPGAVPPTRIHELVASSISSSAELRRAMYISPSATFDPAQSVFRGSIEGTVFQKSGSDVRYRHRQSRMNAFYEGLMNFENGDEVLQVGTFGITSLLSYRRETNRGAKL